MGANRSEPGSEASGSRRVSVRKQDRQVHGRGGKGMSC
jgi:hypothetical protein